MILASWRCRLARFAALAVLMVAVGLLASGTALAAAPLDKLDIALKMIPADAAFYGSTLRNRETVEAIGRSKAWARIMKMPIVEQAFAAYKAQLDTPGSRAAQLDMVLKHPEMQKVVELLTDMTSDEVFMYGDKSFVEFFELLQDLNAAVSSAPMKAQLHGETEGQSPNEMQAAACISTLAQNVKRIGLPNLLLGFKLKDTDLAKEELIKLETFANLLLESNEQTKGRFKKTKFAGHYYLVLTLDGAMIPWDEASLERFEALEAKEGDVQKIVDQIKKSKLVIALGVRDGYLLVSIGRSLEYLEKLGKGPRLMDRDELRPLEKYVDKRLLGVSYASEALIRQTDRQNRNIDSMSKMADLWLTSADLSDEQKGRIKKDVRAFTQDVRQLEPEVGAMMFVKFWGDRGIESYQYTWGGYGRMDDSQPLGLLQHVGGDPILGQAFHFKPLSLVEYDNLVKWVKKGYGYFQEFGVPAMKEEDREKFETFIKAAIPSLERMDKANRECWIPVLADGQVALVIDGRLSSKHFVETMPETEKPMPMVEPALVVGITDAGLFKKGLAEYRAVFNGLIGAARRIEGSKIPEDFQIPKPETVEDSSRTFFSYALPEEWGVDKQIAPRIAVADRVAVFAVTRAQAERLLKISPLGVGGVLAKADRPLAAAGWLNWAALVETATPWADFAAEQAMAEQEMEDSQKKPILDQVHTGLDVLKAIKTISSESYFEEGIFVTHRLAEIQDRP